MFAVDAEMDFLFRKKDYISVLPLINTGIDVKLLSTAVLITITLSAGMVSNAFAQWQWLNPVPESNEFFSGAMQNGNTMWFVGENGSIVVSTDGGATWDAKTNPLRGTPFICLSLVFTDQTTALIAANNGSLLQTYNTGMDWTILPPAPTPVQKLKLAPDGTIFGFGSNGSIAHTSDVGLTWTSFETGITTVVYDIAFPEPGTIVAACGEGIFLTSTDAGGTWTQTVPNNTPDLVSVEFIDAQRGFVLQSNDILLRTLDGGATWTDSTFGASEMRSVRFFDDMAGWIVTNSIGSAYRTSNGGVSWSLINVDVNTHYSFQSCIPVSFTDCIMFGKGGAIFKTTDEGATWIQQGGGITRQHLYGVSALSDVEAWVFGQGSAFHTTDAGATWTPNMAPADPDFRTGHALSSTRLIGGGLQGEVYLSTNGGQDWTTVITLAAGGRIEEFDFINPTSGWLVGAHGTIARTTDGGDTWEEKDPGVTHDFAGIDARSTQEAWVVGGAGHMYATVDGGNTWDAKNSNTPNNLQTIRFASSTDVWAGGAFTLLHSTDAGTTWMPVGGTGIDVAYRIHFTDEQHGFIMASRAILRTSDGGATFYRTDHPASGLRALGLLTDGHAWLVGNYGAVLRYSPAPVIAVAPSYIDFGDVPTNRQVDKTFEVRSVGELPLKVENLYASGTGFLAVSGDSITLAPGASTTFTVGFAPPDTLRYRGFAFVDSDALMGYAIAELVGNGIAPPPPAFTHSPAILDFGQVRIGEFLDKNVTIKNVSTRNILVDDIYPSGPDSANFIPEAFPGGGFYPPDKEDSFQISFKPVKMGTCNSDLIVETNDPATLNYPIPMTGVGMNPVFAPGRDTVFFGFVFEPNPGVETLTIANPGNLPLNLVAPTLGGPDMADFAITQFPAPQTAASATTEVKISFTPGPPYENHTAYIRFETDDFFNPIKDVYLVGRPTNTGIGDGEVIAQGFVLSQNYPNPFSASQHGTTTFNVTVPVRAELEVAVYNVLGEKVRTLLEGDRGAGAYSLQLDAAGLQPGVYFVELRAGARAKSTLQRVRTVLTR